MERDDIEGAKAAAQYFLELYPYVYVSGDLAAWRALSHPECNFCASVIENVEELHGRGGYADGPALDVVGIEAAPPDETYEYFSVWAEVEEAPYAHYDSDGSVVEEEEGARVEMDFALARSDGQWVVRGAVGTDSGEEEDA